MKRVYILSLSTAFLLCSISSFAQQKKQPALIYPKGNEVKAKPKVEKAKPRLERTATKKEKIKAGFGVTVVQIKPVFPGGEDSLLTFIRKNMTYPKKSRESGAEGEVYIGFMISKEGKVKDVRVLASISDELDAEAMRVVQAMPDWKPGYIGDAAVDVQYVLPFSFILPKRL